MFIEQKTSGIRKALEGNNFMAIDNIYGIATALNAQLIRMNTTHLTWQMQGLNQAQLKVRITEKE